MRMRTVPWVGVVALSCLLSQWARAQEQRAQNRTFGIVLATDGNRMGFTLLDKAGNEQPIRLTQSTSLLNNKGEPSTFDEVVKLGWFVRCVLGDDGSVTEITLRGQATQVLPGQLRALLRVTDEEWAVIGPRIDHIRELQRVAESRAAEMGGGSTAGQAAKSVWTELQASVWDSHPSSTKIEENLRTLRELKARAKEDLAQARRELTELLTPRQELLLVMQGVLE